MHENIYGTGSKKILIIHGWLHSSRLYEKLALRLCGRYTVHTIDLPGFGDSADIPLGEPPILDALSEVTERYLLENEFDLIFAHSMGASIILRVLSRRKLCGQIVLSNPAYLGIAYLKRMSTNTAFFETLLLRLSKMPLYLAKPFISLTALFTINDFTLIDDIVISDARRANASVSAALFRELCHDTWRFESTRKDWDISVLISEKDRIISRDNMDILSLDLGCPVDVIPQIGHTTVVENFDFIYEYITQKLERES